MAYFIRTGTFYIYFKLGGADRVCPFTQEEQPECVLLLKRSRQSVSSYSRGAVNFKYILNLENCTYILKIPNNNYTYKIVPRYQMDFLNSDPDSLFDPGFFLCGSISGQTI